MHRPSWLPALGAAALGALLLAAAPAPAAAQPTRARTATTTVPAAASLEAELRQLTRQQGEVAAQLERLVSTLARRRSTPAVSDSLAELVRLHGALSTRLALLEARLRFQETETRLRRPAASARQPEGWFGVHVETVSNAQVGPAGAAVVRSVEYPKVLSVEPGSPAARAGLVAGDRLVAISGVDLRRSAFDPRTLQPGRTLPVRISRDGRLQEMRVAITQRPRTFATGVTVRVAAADELPTGAAGEGRTFVRRLPGGVAGELAALEALPQGVTVLPAGTPMPAPGRTPSAATVFFYANPNVAAVAGVEVMRLDPEFRATLDVGQGVLVVQVGRSSPGERAGLRQGDVLVRANGVALINPMAFQRVVAEARQSGEDGVRLELVRAKRAHTVELRW